MRTHLIAIALLVAPAALTAQRNCKKGIPCGGSCISAGMTCHVGSATPAKTARDTLRPSPVSNGVAPLPVDPAVPAAIAAPHFAGLYDEFSTAIRPWAFKKVVLQNSGADRRVQEGVLSEVKSDHLVVIAAPNRLMIPFSSIELVYSADMPTLESATLTIVIRR